MSIEAMKLALAALETCRIRSVSEWSVEDITPKNVTAAIAALRTAIQQAEVTDGIRPEDFTVDVVVKSMGGFAQINTKGVRVTHKPTGISVTCDAARSQHANRNQAFETLRAILAQQPATDEPVQTTPNFTQLMQILDGLNRCHSRDSKVEFLRSWIRDWTQHKVDKLTHPAPSVLDGYVLVPIEPTDEMMAEMLGPFIAPFIAINDDNRSAFIEAYPRMLTAAQAQKEHMTEIQQPTIFITLQGGVVQSITGDDVNVSIHIRDLDDIEDGADDPMPTDYHPTRVYF